MKPEGTPPPSLGANEGKNAVSPLRRLAPETAGARGAPAASPPSTRELRDAAFVGYQIIEADGVKRHCRTEHYTDSRVQKTTICLSEAQYVREQDKAREMIQNVRSGGATAVGCTTGLGGGLMPCNQ